MSKKWMGTGYLKARPEEVKPDEGIIRGVKVCSVGEAKGHGVHLDEEFIDTLILQGTAVKQGLKARFGHPNMCSTALGTYIGRFKNFSKSTTVRNDGSAAACAIADLHLSDSAKNTPNGDLYDYVMAMAAEESDMFGTSIVFTPGQIYRRNEKGEKVYPRDQRGKWNDEFDQAGGPDCIECDRLHACDCVDEPAANDGLFSVFASKTVAGQITEFLDLNPQVFQVLKTNPDVMEAIAQYGDRFDEFFSQYKSYREKSQPPCGKTETSTTNKEGEMDKDKDLKAEKQPEEKQPKAEELKAAPAAEEKTASVETAVQEALKADRVRQSEIRKLGKKFGFEETAEEFASDEKSVDEFRTHILSKSPEDWRESLKVKNSASQKTEEELSESAGSETVETIKARRQKKYGVQ
jgi:hypothetical protein